MLQKRDKERLAQTFLKAMSYDLEELLIQSAARMEMRIGQGREEI